VTRKRYLLIEYTLQSTKVFEFVVIVLIMTHDAARRNARINCDNILVLILASDGQWWKQYLRPSVAAGGNYTCICGSSADCDMTVNASFCLDLELIIMK
jgi:hypothetical protein